MKMKIRILLPVYCLLSIIVFGCFMGNLLVFPANDAQPTGTSIPTPTRYIIAVNISTATPEASPSNVDQKQTQISGIDFEEIPPGDYLLYEELATYSGIFGINIETRDDIYLSKIWYAYDNQRDRIAYVNDNRTLEIFDLQTRESNEIPLDYRCSGPTWSPDDNYLAINCEDRVYVISVDDLTVHLLTTWAHPSVHSYWNPAWSPDGKWIAITFRQLSSLNVTEDDGLYLLDTSCIMQPSTCEGKMIGPIFPYTHHVIFAWSPNSDYIAAYGKYSILLGNINSYESVTLLDEINDVYGLVWSPDGEWIYYSQESEINKVDIYKISYHGGDPILFAEDKGVVFSVLSVDN